MAQYQKSVSIGGSWAKAAELKSGMRAKIVSETNPVPSSFQNKDGSPKVRDVCKIQFEGLNDVLNLALNRATINALVDAFGGESKSWMNKVLTVETEKVRVGGKAVTALYLIPQGYHKEDDTSGYAQVVKNDTEPEIPVINVEEPFAGAFDDRPPVRDEDLPF